MRKPLFCVKRSTHPKYKFLVRGKVLGKWKSRHFATEGEAIAFADEQNAKAAQKRNGDRARPQNGATPGPAEPIPGAQSTSATDFGKLLTPAYLGPRIRRYLGDSWSMHLPFGYDLMRELAPKVFVELGVKEGESYFAFCQSAAENNISVRCYGVDSWRGDIQTGELDPRIQQEVEQHNWQYSSFSELKVKYFAEALVDFADASIDLLHIDGTHIYSEVKSDFESWLPKVSPNGIILFHDVILHDRGFGVWRLWEEIAREDNSFLFEFGYGLGVWKKRPVGPEDPSFIRRLLGANRTERLNLNAYYANAAAALALWENLRKQGDGGGPVAQLEAEERTRLAAQLQRDLEEKSEQVGHFQRDAAEKAKHVALLQEELEKTRQQVVHFQHEFEEKAKHVALLQEEVKERSKQITESERQLLEKSQQAAAARAEAEDKSKHVTQLQRDLDEKSGQVTSFQRENDRQSERLARLRSQLETASEELARARDEVLDARWETLTLRGVLARRNDSSETGSFRLRELEGRVAAVASERDQLRTMVASLQNALEQERSKQDELRTTQAQLKAIMKELRLERKQMDRLRDAVSRKLILPFGRSQRKLQQLTATRRADD